MKMIKRLMITGLVFLLASCHHTPLLQQLSANEKNQLEPVYQFAVIGSKVTFIVKSHGCTIPEHFELKQNQSYDTVELALLRVKPDWCRAMPRAYPVSFTLNTPVQQQNVVLLNPIEKKNKLPKSSKGRNRG